ncbi:MAG: glycogen synthase GlgA [Christensenellales bacterium]|jgi:starch synthase
MKVLFAASECVPFAKTGGLADVVGTLPQVLAKEGLEVSVIMPLYRDIPQVYKDRIQHVMYMYVNLGWRRQYCGIEMMELDGIHYFFIDNEYYFGRDSIYGHGNDEGERFGFFCRAVLEALPHIGIPDILHCNDWQTGMIPMLLKTQYQYLTQYAKIKTVYTIHNLQYQGVFAWSWISEMLGVGDEYFDVGQLEYYGCINFMKGGIRFGDYLTTVSPTYAEEIKSPWMGEHLDGVIRDRGDQVMGILNGIDTKEYDPRTDRFLAHHYDETTLHTKEKIKRSVRDELGLYQTDGPLIAMITRLAPQKGIDLVEYALDEIMKSGAQLAVLGMGDAHYVDFFKWAQWRYSGMCAVRCEMNEWLAHQLYAGSDMLLMPSQFEPCGLSQMVAMRYGTIPVVRETGGLKDTVVPYNEYTGEGNGFSFGPFNSHDMLQSIWLAQRFYHEKPVWERIQKQAMASDFTWGKSAREYKKLYESLQQDTF